jgi:hypothetical protein
MAVTVEPATDVTPELVEALERLVPQVSSSAPPPDADELEEIIASPVTTLFLARDDAGTIVGTLTLCVFRIPTGVRAWIEDVVVDGAPRQGAGRALMCAAMDHAVAVGSRTVDLTSRPSREAANAMYVNLGFELRTTNCYRWTQPT